MSDSGAKRALGVIGGGRRCSVCEDPTEDADFLRCGRCRWHVHVQCLRGGGTPGGLLGDVFFDYVCAKCVQSETVGPSTSTAACERLVRHKLPWVSVLTLTLYNLSIKSRGLSNAGFFHWRTHIASFIEKHWSFLFDPTTRRPRNWMGSISGTLSHHSPRFFTSGQKEVKESGWWRLTHYKLTPRQLHKMLQDNEKSRPSGRSQKRRSDSPCSPADFTEVKRPFQVDRKDDVSEGFSCSREIPYMGCKPKVAEQLDILDEQQEQKETPVVKQEAQDGTELSAVQSHLMDFLAETLSNDDLDMFNGLPPDPLLANVGGFVPLIDETRHEGDIFDVPELEERPDEFPPQLTSSERSVDSDCDEAFPDDLEEEEDESFQPRILQVTNFQQSKDTKPAEPMPKDDDDDETPEEPEEATPPKSENEKQKKRKAVQGLWKPTEPRDWPWLTEESSDEGSDAGGEDPEEFLSGTAEPNAVKTEDAKEAPKKKVLTLMNEYEERELFFKLRKIFSLETSCNLSIPTYVRRFYRRLCLREWKRENSRAIFNLDLEPNDSGGCAQYSEPRIIDRFQLLEASVPNPRGSFHSRLVGSMHYEHFKSPYTKRYLNPFIYRSKECVPPWLKLMCQLKYVVNGTHPTRAPIDYCYVRPNHIPAINALLRSTFWPGIDMTECLTYPDFTVVALYKHLVVGCAFLVPDVGFNEAYISFMAVRPCWQRSGIATFMLYHLIQTCLQKDITLHVSATNDAVFLYQKFGFKIEEIVYNFYDKYLPFDSRQSRHAFFLRLLRS